MISNQTGDALEKKLMVLLGHVLSQENRIDDPKTYGYCQIVGGSLKTDKNDEYYLHLDLYIKSNVHMVYHQGIEAAVVNKVNELAMRLYKETVRVKIRDYTLIVDQDFYEIIYTKKIRKKI